MNDAQPLDFTGAADLDSGEFEGGPATKDSGFSSSACRAQDTRSGCPPSQYVSGRAEAHAPNPAHRAPEDAASPPKNSIHGKGRGAGKAGEHAFRQGLAEAPWCVAAGRGLRCCSEMPSTHPRPPTGGWLRLDEVGGVDHEAVCVLVAAGSNESCLFASVTVVGPLHLPRSACPLRAAHPLLPGSSVVVLGGELQKPGQRFHAKCGHWRQRDGPEAARAPRTGSWRDLLAPARTRHLMPPGDGPDVLPPLRGNPSQLDEPPCLFSCMTGMLGGPPAGMASSHGALPGPNALVTAAVAQGCPSVPVAAAVAAAIVDAVDGAQAVSGIPEEGGDVAPWGETLSAVLGERMGGAGATFGLQIAHAMKELVPSRFGSGSEAVPDEATQLHSVHAGLGVRQLCAWASAAVALVCAPS